MKELSVIAVDTGPLVALCADDDSYHSACMQELARLRRNCTLLTVEPVITEAFQLLHKFSLSRQRLFQLLQDARVSVVALTKERLARIEAVMAQYEDLGIDFADAALFATCEDHKIIDVFTLDARDFAVLKPRHAKYLRLIP